MQTAGLEPHPYEDGTGDDGLHHIIDGLWRWPPTTRVSQSPRASCATPNSPAAKRKNAGRRECRRARANPLTGGLATTAR